MKNKWSGNTYTHTYIHLNLGKEKVDKIKEKMFKECMAQNLLDFMKDSILNQEIHVFKIG